VESVIHMFMCVSCPLRRRHEARQAVDRLSQLSEGGAWQAYQQRLAGQHSHALVQKLSAELEAAQIGQLSDVRGSLDEMRNELQATRATTEEHQRAMQAARMLVQ
jgi:hypothetical protein